MAQECFDNASDSPTMLLFAESYQDPTLTKKGKKLSETKHGTEIASSNFPSVALYCQVHNRSLPYGIFQYLQIQM